jgi:hypothetical protein
LYREHFLFYLFLSNIESEPEPSESDLIELEQDPEPQFDLVSALPNAANCGSGSATVYERILFILILHL